MAKKVYVVCLGNHGPAGRKRGAIIHMAECDMTENLTFGSGVKPPAFETIVLENKSLKDLPAAMREYGGHRSRRLINLDGFGPTITAGLTSNDAYKIAYLTVVANKTDQGDDWRGVELTPEIIK